MKFHWNLSLALPCIMALSPVFGQINAGPDQTICYGETVNLFAVATGGYGTDSYSFELFPYQPETYSGGTPVTFGGNQDDQIAGPFQLGFQFCFFNQYYSQFYIGSNGWVGFTHSSSYPKHQFIGAQELHHGTLAGLASWGKFKLWPPLCFL